jgi:glycosyltransferase involved in cell wall biosynthesis
MRPRVVILTEIIAPYRVPVFNALANRGEVDLHVIFLSETDPSQRQWEVLKDEIQFSYRVLPNFRRRLGTYNVLLNRGLAAELARAAPDVILCGGYSYVASWQLLRWAQRRQVPVVLWSESNASDFRAGYFPVEAAKRWFIHRCAGYLAAGTSSRQYLLDFGVLPERIGIAPSTVDVPSFEARAAAARSSEAAYRAALHLPHRYFVSVGRLVPEKGVFVLLEAYASLEERLRREVGLVFVGDGPSRAALMARAAHLEGQVSFAGFVQPRELAPYYALSEAFVFPTFSDPWGLVVNEAMACGAAVIASQVAGCAADLVHEDNGILVPPKNVAMLTQAMRALALHPAQAQAMGARGQQRIQAFSPAAWAAAVVDAVARLHPARFS